MQNEIRSYNTTVMGLNVWRFVTPDIPLVCLYISLSLLLFLIFNGAAFWGLLAQLNGGVSFSTSLSQNFYGLYQIWKAISTSNLMPALFWGALGCLLYLVVWFFKTLLNNIRNDLAVADYVHPATYKEYLYWRSIVLRRLYFIVALLTSAGFLYMLLRVLVPLDQYAFLRVTRFDSWSYLGQVLGVLLISIIMLHFFTLLVKLTVDAWRFIYKDL